MDHAAPQLDVFARADEGSLRLLGDKVERVLAKLSQKIHSAKHEHLYIVDRDGTVLVHAQGGKRRVKMPADVRAVVLAHPGRFVVLHNHPGGKTFSAKDLTNVVADGYRETRVVTPKGRVYRAQPIGRHVPLVFADAARGAYVRAKEAGEKPTKRWLNTYRAKLFAQGLHYEPVINYAEERLPKTARQNPANPCGCCHADTVHLGDAR